LIIGLGGTCREQELTNLLSKNVQEEEQVFHLYNNIKYENKHFSNFFVVIVGRIDGLNIIEIILKYTNDLVVLCRTGKWIK
jgi:hypothetical protein